MSRFLILSILGLLRCCFLSAQQLPQFQQLHQQGFIHNPAMTAPYGRATVGGSAVQFWRGFTDAPQTANIFAQLPLAGNSSIGLNLTKDRVGFWQQLSVQSTYAYQIPLGGRRAPQLAIGLGVALVNNSFNLNEPIVNQTEDPFLMAEIPNQNDVKLTGGFFFSTANNRYSASDHRFYVGLSASYFTSSFMTKSNIFRGERVLHANALIGYQRYFEYEGWLEFSLQSEYLSQTILGGSASLRYAPKDYLWVGINWQLFEYSFFAIGFQGSEVDWMALQCSVQIILPGRLTGGGLGYGIGVSYEW